MKIHITTPLFIPSRIATLDTKLILTPEQTFITVPSTPSIRPHMPLHDAPTLRDWEASFLLLVIGSPGIDLVSLRCKCVDNPGDSWKCVARDVKDQACTNCRTSKYDRQVTKALGQGVPEQSSLTCAFCAFEKWFNTTHDAGRCELLGPALKNLKSIKLLHERDIQHILLAAAFTIGHQSHLARPISRRKSLGLGALAYVLHEVERR